MKNSNNHSLHLVLILMMLLVSVIVVQIPTDRHGMHNEHHLVQMHPSVSNRVQSLIYTGDIDSIVDGLSRYFVGSMQEALHAFSNMEQCPLSFKDKEAIFIGLVNKLRKNESDQALICKHLVEVYSALSKEPILYAAVKSKYPDTVKDIIRWGVDYKYHSIDTLMFDAFKHAVNVDDLKSVEKLYLYGAYLTKNQASELLKVVVCENKKIDMAKFFIERTHADPHYVDDNNKSLLSYALARNNKLFVEVIKNSKKNEIGTLIALR